MATPEGPTMSVRALSSRDPRAVVFVIDGRIQPEDVSRLCDFVCDRLQSYDIDRIVCDLRGVIASDAVAVDALARLQLAAHRQNRRVELQHASRELQDLLVLVGLDEVMPVVDA